MKFSLDMDKSEQMRYDEIKKGGEYLELDILIGSGKRNSYNGHVGNVPVITTIMHGIGAEEIAYLYATLKQMEKKLENDYPLECLYSSLTMKTTPIDEVTHPINHKEV